MTGPARDSRVLAITGIRGVPAAHGGFETFAHRLSLHLAERGWEITVYCQEEGLGAPYEDSWNGVRRVHIPVAQKGAFGTVIFDWKSIRHAVSEGRRVLTLGYNTGIFNLLLRFAGVVNVINMDGFEWKRKKWKWYQRAWLWLNERAACFAGDHLIADHPEIAKHLLSIVSEEKVSMIPYGADEVVSGDLSVLEEMGLVAAGFSCVIARPEPENSILEIVEAFSSKRRDHKLLVLGSFDASNAYHQRVMASASDEVLFPGAIYDGERVAALRYYSLIYFHGHQVGGTNPSLVEALGSGCACLAHDNRFNRWVAADAALYFACQSDLSAHIQALLGSSERIEDLKVAARKRHAQRFLWSDVLSEYEDLLSR